MTKTVLGSLKALRTGPLSLGAIALGALVLSTVTLPASAADLPKYDTTTYCNNFATQGGQVVKERLDFCLNLQSTNKEELSKRWASLPVEIQDGCADFVRKDGRLSYVLLGFCVQEQLKGSGGNPSGKGI